MHARLHMLLISRDIHEYPIFGTYVRFTHGAPSNFRYINHFQTSAHIYPCLAEWEYGNEW